MNGEENKLQVKENMFGEFNEATQLKTSLAKYSIEYNRVSRTNTSASNSVFEAVRQILHIAVCQKVCGQTSHTCVRRLVSWQTKY